MRLPPKAKTNEALEDSVENLVHPKNGSNVRIGKVRPKHELTLQIHKDQDVVLISDYRSLQLPPQSPDMSSVRSQIIQYGGRPLPSPQKDSQIYPRIALSSPRSTTTVPGTPLTSPKEAPTIKSDTSPLLSKLMPTASGTPLASPRRLKVVTRTPLTSPRKQYPQSSCEILHAKEICPLPSEEGKQAETVSCFVELFTTHLELPDGNTVSLSPKIEIKMQEGCKIEVSNQKPVKTDVDCEKGEKVCRMCYMPLSNVGREQGADAVDLGCACKNDLAIAHRRCAETWFTIRGNRTCEICGAAVQNILTTSTAKTSGFLSRWKGRTILHTNSVETRWWNRQPLCNLLLTLIVVAFLLPWLFHVNIFS